ncbi:MAG: Holliday junction resolvase RuvX [Clostridiales bacterium]|nr:Holliday junction resolvase RuvX [Clostridiales bacterium]
MIILSVDYGDARTGLAACDKFEMLASPVGVIISSDMTDVIEKTVETARQKNAGLIVVGYPKNMDATIGERAEKCAEFAKLLEERSGIKTVLWDERLTTVSAHGVLNETNVRGKKRKAVIDSVAAVMILQSYMDYRRNTDAK